MKGLEDVQFTISSTPRQHTEFLRRLGTDDVFRDRLVKDPVRVLAENGIHVKPQDLPEKITLPSKEEFRTKAPVFLAYMI